MGIPLNLSAILPFALGAAALLAAPGPTNVLLIHIGAQRGVRRGLAVLPVALIAYLAAIGALMMLLNGVASPALEPALRLLAALWLVVLGLRLWRSGPSPVPPAAHATALAITTALNPKVLMFASLLFPLVPFAIGAMLFVVLALGTGTAYLAIGAALPDRSISARTRARLFGATQFLFAVILLGTILR